ncbi:MAG TPA: hypothetical protein VK509_12450 [Polyangiales bacterium]|nr:hypothetical protein [Polyangiales bacterium]
MVDSDAGRARALAQALQSSGATVIAISAEDADHHSAHGLDAEVMLVNADEADACRPVVAMLRAHPRTRWTTVVPLSFAELWPSSADAPDLAAIANAVGTLAVSAVELAVRTKGKLPYDTVLEPLGPSRTLRALGNTGRKLRVLLSDGRMRAELELEDGKLGGVRVCFKGAQRTLVNAPALAEVLALSMAEVRVEERTTATLSDWNVSLTAALATAAAIGLPGSAHSGTRPVIAAAESEPADAGAADEANPDPGAKADKARVQDGKPAPQRVMQPTVPQISLADALAGEPAAEAPAQERAVEPASRRSQRPTERHISLAEVLAEAESLRADERQNAAIAEPSSEPIAREAEPAPRAHAPVRRRAAASMAAGALVAAAVLASAALFVHDGRAAKNAVQSMREAFEPARALAPTQPRPHVAAGATAQPMPVPVAGPLAEARPELALSPAHAQADSAAPPLARAAAPTRQELERAERLVKAASRRQRAKRYEEAATGYLRALELVPDHSPAVLGLVRVQLQTKNAAEALSWAQRLNALQPERRTSLLLLGDAYALAGDDARAQQAWRQSSQLGSTTASKRLRGR